MQIELRSWKCDICGEKRELSKDAGAWLNPLGWALIEGFYTFEGYTSSKAREKLHICPECLKKPIDLKEL